MVMTPQPPSRGQRPPGYACQARVGTPDCSRRQTHKLPKRLQEPLAKLVLLLGLCGVLGLPSLAWAQKVEASLDQRSSVVGEPVTLSITVEGGEARVPMLPNMPNVRSQFAGTQTSFQSINFSFTRQTTFNYQLIPLKAGSVNIPAISVEVEGKTVSTRPLTLTVRPAGAASPSSGLPGAPGEAGSASPETNGDASGDSDVQVTAELEPRKVYVGQAVLQKVKIAYAVPLAGQIQVSRRPVAGTIEETLGDDVQQRSRELIDGMAYTVEQARWLFYPTTAGPLVVPAMELTVPLLERQRRRQRIDPFFDSMFGGVAARPRLYQTEEQTLKVLPLPSPAPADFTRLVGQFQVAVQTPSSSLKLGDSLTQTIVIQGEGNLRDYQLPPLTLEKVKVYDDKPELEVSVTEDGRVRSRKVFKRALVPQVVGPLSIPALTLSYFDPKLEQYQTASSGALTLEVLPGAGGEQSLLSSTGTQPEPVSAQKSVAATGADDILPLKQGEALLVDRRAGLGSFGQLSSGQLSSGQLSPGLWGLFLLPLGLYGVALGVSRARARAEADPSLKRRRQALSVAKLAFSEVEKSREEGRLRLDQLSRIVRTYLGDKLQREGGALTPQEAGELLRKHQVSGPVVQELVALLQALEEARYAPGAGSEVAGLLSRAREVVLSLEREGGLR